MRSILTALLLLVANGAMAQLELTIAVEPPTTLPGIRPSLRIQVRNTSSVPAEVPTTVALLVTAPGSEPFLAGRPGPGNHITTELRVRKGDSTIIPAGETRDFTLWTAGYSAPPWFVTDRRVAAPGLYRLQLIAGVDATGPTYGHTERSSPQPQQIVSNETTYTIVEPTGDDAEVWSRIRELPDPDTWPRDLAEEIWQEHPESAYAAYCVPRKQPFDLDRTIDLYEIVIGRRSDPVTRDAFRLALAKLLLQRVFHAVTDGSLAEAMAATERARELFTDLARGASDPQTRQTAADKLQSDIQSRSELLEDMEAAQGRSPSDVRPGVDCIEEKTDGSSVIWFAYQNPSRDPITEPIGPRNKFTPPPFDRSQPTRFAPGVHHLVFTIPATVPELTWHLHKSELVVKTKDVTKCSADDLAQYRAWHSATP